MKVRVGSIQLNVDCSGNKNGPVVMMAHSLGCNLRMWDPQMQSLEADYRIIRLDMRGHGLSDVPSGPYSLDELADDVIGVMDSLVVEQAHWVGLSVGGMIGQSLLLRYPGRFFSAALCDTASSQPPAAGPIWEARIQAVESGGLESIVDATMERWFTPGFLANGNKAADAVREQLRTTSDAAYVASCHAIMKLDFIGRLSEIKIPVSILVGAEDGATPVASSEAIHERITDSELHIIENASHISNVEQADVFNSILLQHLRKVT